MRARDYTRNRVGLLPKLDYMNLTAPIQTATPPATTATDPGLPMNTQATNTAETVTAQGHILDDKTGAFIFGVTVTLLNAQGNPAADPITLADNSNTFTVWTGNPAGSSILFQKAGYQPTLLAFNDLVYNDAVYMIKGETTPAYTWALLALVPLFLMSKNKKKKVTGLDPGNVTSILLIVGGVLGLTLLMKILQKLGIFAGPGTQSVEDEQKNPFSPWKPQFWKQYTSFTYVIDEDEARSDASIIYGAFKLWTDDFNAIFGAISSLKTQANVSYLADIFNQEYDADLLSFLTDGGGILPWDGLNETHLKTITDYVKNLPTH